MHVYFTPICAVSLGFCARTSIPNVSGMLSKGCRHSVCWCCVFPERTCYSWLPSILDVHAKCQKCHVFWVTATELSEFTQPVISLPCADNGIFDLLLIVMSNEIVNTTMFWYAKNSIFHNLCDVSEWRCRARRSEWKQKEVRQIGTKLATDSELNSNSCANISSFFRVR